MKNLQLGPWLRPVFGAVLGILLAGAAQAQTAQDAAEVPSGSIPLATSSGTIARATGAKIYLTDTNNHLWTFDTGTKGLKYIGRTSQELKDISFAPGGKLYGVTFTQFYRVNPSNGSLTFIGNLGASGINALFCYSNSACYAHSYSQAKLYRINIATGRATVIGSTGSFKSGGDLVKVNGALYLASDNAAKRLVKLNPSTGAVLSSVSVGLTNLYGLAAPGNKLYGFANTAAYTINQSTGTKTLVKNLSSIAVPGVSFRVQQIFGAAYDGNY